VCCSSDQDPPETATPELDELVTGVVDDCSPLELLVDEVVDEEVADVDAVAVELVLVPGIV
jgi:hypothetical protein